ncbi:hypothetical protein WJX74_010916 [Apatococcus lobatus]|uniref:Uncharacterized protein n=1 Tax=Apatococcus lobatus TaxID=904363 RepID=A0AAW1SBA9_9CHLO
MTQEAAAFLHVLVVDANSSTRADTTQQLETCNYKVTSVASLDEQLSQLHPSSSSGSEAAELPRVDVALVEHAPPEGSAQPVIKHLLEFNLNVPVIVTSLLDDRQGVLECLYWGADDYLIRPLRLNELGNIWVHLWRRVHPPPGLVSVKPRPSGIPTLGLRPSSRAQDANGHRPGEDSHLISNEGSNPSTGEAARTSDPDSQLASIMRESLPGSGLRSATGLGAKSVQVQSESQQPRNVAMSSQQIISSDHGSNQPTEVFDPRGVWEEPAGGPRQATTACDAGFHGQQPAADVGGQDGGKQGFRAWMPPLSSQQSKQPPSRKRDAPGAEPGAQANTHADAYEGLPGDAPQLMQSNSMSAMHRPGGPALHSRTKQCLRSGQAAQSHVSPSWDGACPSYTELARQQSQKQGGPRAPPLLHDVLESSGALQRTGRDTAAQPSAGREAPANQEPWHDSSHLQAFAAGMAAASATMGGQPLAQHNPFSSPSWVPSAGIRSHHVAALNSQRAQEAPHEHAADLAARYHRDMQQRFGCHSHSQSMHEPAHDLHRATPIAHSVRPHAINPNGPEGSAQGGPRDYRAWEQAQSNQEEYEYLHSLWQQHFKPDSFPSEQQCQPETLQHRHEQTGLTEGSNSCMQQHGRADDRRGRQDAMLWQALQQHKQRQPSQAQQQQQHCRADESPRLPSSNSQAREAPSAQGLPLMPQFPWPGLDAASPEAQAFVAAYASYFSQASGSASLRPPLGQAAGQAQRDPETRAGEGERLSQPRSLGMWGSRSSEHASGSYCSIPGAQGQDVSEQPQHSCRRSSLSDRDTFSRPADVSQAGGQSKTLEGCKARRPPSVGVPSAANSQRRGSDSQRPGKGSTDKDPSAWGSSSSQSIPRSSAGPLITSPSPNLVTDAPAPAASAQVSVEPTSRERRAAALQKYKQKRKNLCHTRKIRYEMRKQLAQARPRVRGQFVKTNPLQAGSNITAPVSSGPAVASSLASQASMDPSQGEDALSDVEEMEDAEDEDSDEDAQQHLHVEQQQLQQGPVAAGPSGPPLAAMQALISAGMAAFPHHEAHRATTAGTGSALPLTSNPSSDPPSA